jgi:hypothetical protein
MTSVTENCNCAWWFSTPGAALFCDVEKSRWGSSLEWDIVGDASENKQKGNSLRLKNVENNIK